MQGTIIVVDDNKGVLSAVKLLLKNSFERIITLTSPITLPAVLREENAQVVLLDILGLIPAMKGFTGCTK